MDIINRALSVKGGSAKLLYVYVDVEPVSFNRGFYTVDMRFFYSVTLQAYLSCPAPVTVEGLCVFDKRVILFGSEGNAKIFSSKMSVGGSDAQMMKRANAPIAVVEAVDPIVLDVRLMDGFRQSVEYFPKPHVKKQVVYFLASPEADDTVTKQEEEISDYRWCLLEEADGLVTFRNDKNLIREAKRFLTVKREP